MKFAHAELDDLVVDGFSVAQQCGVYGIERAVTDIPTVRLGNGGFGVEVGDGSRCEIAVREAIGLAG